MTTAILKNKHYDTIAAECPLCGHTARVSTSGWCAIMCRNCNEILTHPAEVALRDEARETRLEAYRLERLEVLLSDSLADLDAERGAKMDEDASNLDEAHTGVEDAIAYIEEAIG